MSVSWNWRTWCEPSFGTSMVKELHFLALIHPKQDGTTTKCSISLFSCSIKFIWTKTNLFTTSPQIVQYIFPDILSACHTVSVFGITSQVWMKTWFWPCWLNAWTMMITLLCKRVTMSLMMMILHFQTHLVSYLWC